MNPTAEQAWREAELLYSGRKTMELEITPAGRLILRLPKRCGKREAYAFVCGKEAWLTKQLAKVEKQNMFTGGLPPYSEQLERELEARAREYIPPRVAYYAARAGVTPQKITFRHQKTRWGSCSAKGNLSFNCLLMLMDERIVDAVIVHEVCHLKHMDHSARFYACVRALMPDYDEQNRLLKAQGRALMAWSGK